MKRRFVTSEAVSRGHPDKLADQISDTILDAYIAQDPHAKVACETLVSKDLIVVAGEVASHAQVDAQGLVKQAIQEAGYVHDDPWQWQKCDIVVRLKAQSPDIARVVDPEKNPYKELGAGDQGIMIGYACDETTHLMPLPITLAHALISGLDETRKEFSFLLNDAKSEVTVEYDEIGNPLRVENIVLSCQHRETVSLDDVQKVLKKIVHRVIPEHFIDSRTHIFCNPAGRFVIGGPNADTGVTGRKELVDSYGTSSHIGGGAFSGKDPTKVDRSSAYAARYVAKNIVAAKIATACEVQLAYAIGLGHPINVCVHTFGTGLLDDEKLTQQARELFDFSLAGIITRLDLLRPIYRKTAYGGHFGRADPDFTWERLDRVDELRIAMTNY